MYPADDLMLLTDPPRMSKWSRLRPWALSSIINHCFNMPAWFFCFLASSDGKMVDKIWQSLAMCKLNTASYPQNQSTVADDVIPSGSGSVGFNCPQSDYQPQQLILVTTWGCPTWVLRPQPFVDIFWAWCTCHVSCWWSHVTHRPSKNVKVVSSPSLGFVFNHQPLLQYACLIFRPLASPDSKMVDRIWQSLAECKLNTASYPQNLSTVADDVIPSGSGSVGFSCPLSDYQPQQLVLVTTWGCPTWVLHPQPFADIFWAWCTCHVSCWWSHVAHRPSKNVKVVSSPSLGFVFNHQPLLQYACLIFRPLVSSDDGFDTTHIHTKMVDRIRQSLAMCKLNTATYPQNLSTVADDVIPSGKMWFTMLTTVTKALGSMLTLHVEVCGVAAALQDSKSARSAKSNNLQQLEAVQHRCFTLSLSHLLSMTHISCILVRILDLISHKHSDQNG